MENIYGADTLVHKIQKADEGKKIIDAQCTTFFIREKIFFVLVGFEEGYKFNDGTSAQGKALLQVYKMNPKTNVPDILILNEELNNITFDYCNFKNYCPYLKHQDNIFYFKIENDRDVPGGSTVI